MIMPLVTAYMSNLLKYVADSMSVFKQISFHEHCLFLIYFHYTLCITKIRKRLCRLRSYLIKYYIEFVGSLKCVFPSLCGILFTIILEDALISNYVELIIDIRNNTRTLLMNWLHLIQTCRLLLYCNLMQILRIFDKIQLLLGHWILGIEWFLYVKNVDRGWRNQFEGIGKMYPTRKPLYNIIRSMKLLLSYQLM